MRLQIGRAVAAMALFSTLLFLRLLNNSSCGHGLYTSILSATGVEADLATPTKHIPNTVHYVYILTNCSGDLNFAFSELLSVYAVWYYWRPDAIYLHTNASPESLERARGGAASKYTRLLLQVSNLKIAKVEAPTHTRGGKNITVIEHKSDFVRVQAIREYGGIYLDFDVHPLRDIAAIRESGFQAIVGRQKGDEINSGVFMSNRHSKMIELWAEGMHAAYDGQWSTHSNGALTTVCERLVAEPREMLIMERHAFAPGSWMREDTTQLLETHDDESPSLDTMDPEGHLPQYAEKKMTRRTMHAEHPAWATDWTKSYMLHAFNHNQRDFQIQGFDCIKPRYILERRSNMGRAIYPIARELYEKGLVEIDDPCKFNID